MSSFEVVTGDCREVMRGLDAESVDAIVTDPPYGLEFMGKAWDRLDDGPNAERWNGRRTATSKPVRDAGHPAGRSAAITSPSKPNPQCGACGHYRFSSTPCKCDQPSWIPRANPQAVGMQRWHESWCAEALRVLKPGGHLLAFGGTRTYHRLAVAIEDAGFEIRDCISWLYGSGFPKSRDFAGERIGGERVPLPQFVGTPFESGFGTALKPAFEPIVVARKPLVGTVAANVERYGVGALNIDGCRIAANDAAYKQNCSGDRGHADNRKRDLDFAMGCGKASDLGRWPANVALDEEAAAMLDAQSGESKSTRSARGGASGNKVYGAFAEATRYQCGHADSGGASRFFYCAKASRSERNAGLDGMPERFNPTMGDGIGEREHSPDDPRSYTRNHHPTVKPIALMRWLVRLVTPPGGIVFDPFTGSGSTGCAAVRESFDFLGCDLDAEYVEIARRRIAHHATIAEESRDLLAQSSLFEDAA